MSATMACGSDWLGLRDRVCAVTGAGGGLGRAIAAGLAQVGALVVLLDRHAERLAEDMRRASAEPTA